MQAAKEYFENVDELEVIDWTIITRRKS